MKKRGKKTALRIFAICLLVIIMATPGIAYAQVDNSDSDLVELLIKAEGAQLEAEALILVVGSEGDAHQEKSGLLKLALDYCSAQGIVWQSEPSIADSITFKDKATDDKSTGDQNLEKAQDSEVELGARKSRAQLATEDYGHVINDLKRAKNSLWQFLPEGYRLSAADEEIIVASQAISETSLYLNYDLITAKGITRERLGTSLDKLDDATNKASIARTAFEAGDYAQAMSDAAKARALAGEAYVLGKGVEAEWNANNELHVTASTIMAEAETQVRQTRDFLNSLLGNGASRDELAQAFDKLEGTREADGAQDKMGSAEEFYKTGDHVQAIANANQAKNLTWQAKESALWDCWHCSPDPIPWWVWLIITVAILVVAGVSIYAWRRDKASSTELKKCHEEVKYLKKKLEDSAKPPRDRGTF